MICNTGVYQVDQLVETHTNCNLPTHIHTYNSNCITQLSLYTLGGL